MALWRHMDFPTTRSHRQETQRPSTATPLLGRDELNLIDFPIGTLSYKQPLNADGSRPEELVFSVETLMNWPHNSSSKRQLQTGLDRLSGVKLQYENS